jgi:hypothetical protein
MDFLVGRLLAELDSQALDDSTIVAFNGVSFVFNFANTAAVPKLL